MRAIGLLIALTLPGCLPPYSDPLLTGVLVAPNPGEWIGPVDLRVLNETGATLRCAAYEDTQCPSLASFIDELSALPDGETVELLQVDCAFVDVVRRTNDEPQTEPPRRAWSWSIVPPED